ncbi:unnamed protein product, partial [Iphiclides podalirius]
MGRKLRIAGLESSGESGSSVRSATLWNREARAPPVQADKFYCRSFVLIPRRIHYVTGLSCTDQVSVDTREVTLKGSPGNVTCCSSRRTCHVCRVTCTSPVIGPNSPPDYPPPTLHTDCHDATLITEVFSSAECQRVECDANKARALVSVRAKATWWLGDVTALWTVSLRLLCSPGGRQSLRMHPVVTRRVYGQYLSVVF